MKEPNSVTRAREIVQRYDADGVCPVVANAEQVCVWTCPECRATMPPTHATHVEGGHRYPARCALKGQRGATFPEGRPSECAPDCVAEQEREIATVRLMR